MNRSAYTVVCNYIIMNVVDCAIHCQKFLPIIGIGVVELM